MAHSRVGMARSLPRLDIARRDDDLMIRSFYGQTGVGWVCDLTAQ